MRDLGALEDGARPSAVFYGVDSDLARAYGDPNDGAAVAIRTRTARMRPWVERAEELGYHPADVGILRGDDPQSLLEDVVSLAGGLARRGLRPVAIGCDHMVSYAQVLGVSAARPTYVYFDAHLDLGRHRPGRPALHNGSFVDALLRGGRVREAINVGARAWSTWSPAYRELPGLRILRVEGSDDRSAADALGAIDGGPVYVSLDADVLDPAWAPDVCCPEPFGLSPRELLGLCTVLGRRCTIVGADVSELRGTSGSTAEVLLRCLHALLEPSSTPDPS